MRGELHFPQLCLLQHLIWVGGCQSSAAVKQLYGCRCANAKHQPVLQRGGLQRLPCPAEQLCSPKSSLTTLMSCRPASADA